MVADVLAALSRVAELDALVVVTAEPLAAEAARGGRRARRPRPARGRPVGGGGARHRGRPRAARRASCSCRATAPRSSRRRSAALLEGFPAADVVIVPDRHGHGTNALRLAPPEVLAPAFGPGSFARHAARAAAAGAAVRVAHAPSLELDVDTPDDLAALRAALAARPDAAPRTRAALARLAPAVA